MQDELTYEMQGSITGNFMQDLAKKTLMNSLHVSEKSAEQIMNSSSIWKNNDEVTFVQNGITYHIEDISKKLPESTSKVIHDLLNCGPDGEDDNNER